ncbi:MAG TPA: Mce protein [Mycobacterium sp.]|jgi:Mce-associated membrane protein|nr:Mce protein [Mycobacterium sp.]
MAEHADASRDEVNNDEGASESPNEVASEQTSSEAAEVQTEDAEDYDDAVDADVDDDPKDVATEKKSISPVRLATVLGVVVVVAVTALAGWLGFRDYQAHQAQAQRALLIQVGRQGALNLTTIDWQHADTDIQRILDSATGTFYDDFSKRSKPFIDVVKKAQSKSAGTVVEAGLESQSGDEAQVLVAVSVKTSNAGAAEEEPRHWRMRISVKKVGDEAKVSNVEFVQ